jgi:hypothetical protein
VAEGMGLKDNLLHLKLLILLHSKFHPLMLDLAACTSTPRL